MIKKTYYADIIGAPIPIVPWEGLVQSIYSKAVNLLHPSGYLISIVDSIENMTDFGIAVTDFKVLTSRISNGSKFQWKDGKIIFTNLIIDLSKASSWTGAIFIDHFKNFPDIAPLKSAFINITSDEGLSPVLTNKAGNIYSNAAEKLLEKAVINENISNGTLIDLSATLLV